jgi:hypothetical protein
MILLDYSQVAISNIFNFSIDLKKGSDKDPTNIIRHCVLSSIKAYKAKYGNKYGEVVICCDGRNYWRKGVFPFYKEGRKRTRDESDLDWGLIFNTLSSIRDELKEHFPYKVMHFDECEADDIIATLTMNTLEFGKAQPVLIISSDKDFKQLQNIGADVKQWSPMHKKFVSDTQENIRKYRIEHIVKGDAGDGIPNILSSDDIFASGGKQGRVSSKRLNEFFDIGRDACKNDIERRNWDRNVQLVSFDHIPDYITERILNGYYSCHPKGNRNTILNYLIANRCKLLMQEIEDF